MRSAAGLYPWFASAFRIKPTASLSASSCADLGWDANSYGSTGVCGSSNPGSGCMRNVDWATAESNCANAGARLCTSAELEADEARGTGCSLDGKVVWTSDACNGGYIVAPGSDRSKVSTLSCESTSTSSGGRCCADVFAAGPAPVPAPMPAPATSPEPAPVSPPTSSGVSSTCADLGWDATRYGSADVCGESDMGGGCSGTVNWASAEAFCASVGVRLCTTAELEANEARGTGCGLDRKMVWTSDVCDGGYMASPGSSRSNAATSCEAATSSIATRCCTNVLLNPVPAPTPPPSDQPAPAPTRAPTAKPIPDPTKQPVPAPTPGPTLQPIPDPTKQPVPAPTSGPTLQPIPDPTKQPVTAPTSAPTSQPIPDPTKQPVPAPTSGATSQPIPDPTKQPVPAPTSGPTSQPIPDPTKQPVLAPTSGPTLQPIPDPTKQPVLAPTSGPTSQPIPDPTKQPFPAPTPAPTLQPIPDPTKAPVLQPVPAPNPTPAPSAEPVPELNYIGDNGNPTAVFPLYLCEGDCDDDSECAYETRCFQRSGSTPVPGCVGTPNADKDYCYNPNPGDLFYAGDNSAPAVAFPLGMCEGDCDDDSECASGLLCFQRSGSTPVPGCSGTPYLDKDYCYDPAVSLAPVPEPTRSPSSKSLIYSGSACSPSTPCAECEGDCASDDDACAGDLTCFGRAASESVPGCVTGEAGDVAGADYCHFAPGNGPVTYVPGEATVSENGIVLSTGLSSTIIARAGQKVTYADGTQSTENFHTVPDGAAVFEDAATGGWIYVSNTESSSDGGVGSITFDSSGQVVNYKRVQTGTSRNCGGGKTPWGTWLTCEEVSGGGVWEVSPTGSFTARKTLLGGPTGDYYESAAYDIRDPDDPKFFVTTDRANGPVVRFTPAAQALANAVSNDDYSELLHDDPGGTALLEYLILTPDSSNSNTGTFTWSTSRSAGQANAQSYFPTSEGIDIRNGVMYFTCKAPKHLFILDLDAFTYTRSSTNSGAFDSQPDQLARIIGGDNSDILYFCEDGGDTCGVHGRDSSGAFYTILQDQGSSFGGETTGLAFSPDNIHMYVSFQSPGYIYDIVRTDGYPFGGQRLDIKYHASDSNDNPFVGAE